MTDEEVEGVFKWFDTDTVAEYTGRSRVNLEDYIY